MGVDTKIRLPDNVRLDDVATVIALAAGAKPERRVLDDREPNRTYVRVSDAELTVRGNVEIPTLAEIDVRTSTPMVDGEMHHLTHYHFEPSGGGRLLMPRSTAFWITIGQRLVTFFGGSMDYNDSDDEYNDFVRSPKPDDQDRPEDGQPWWNHMDRIAAVTPITPAEWRANDRYAAYKIDRG